MYQIVAYDSPTETTGHVVFDPRINRYINEGKLNLKETDFDDLTLTVNQMNLLFGNVKPFQTHIEVYQDKTLLFRGRAIDVTRQMKDSGQFIQEFSFAHIQSYLKDTSQRWAKINNINTRQFFQWIIDRHNTQVPEYKRFKVRYVNVTTPYETDNVYRYIEDGSTTWDTIKDKLISRLGGHINIDYINGANYIDYLQDVGEEHKNDTPIQIAKNLQSVSVQIDPTEVITQLVPLGAAIENDEENPNPDTTVSQPRIDIASVNAGRDYIDIPNLQEEFGIIRKSVTWDDVHDPVTLLSKAKQWITEQSSAKESWTISALELPDLESFKVSDQYLFIDQNVASPQMLRVTEKSIDLLNWQKSSLTIADKKLSLAKYQLENQSAQQQVSRLKLQVQAYTGRISTLNREQQNLQNKVEEYKKTLDEIEQDVKNADLKSIKSKLDDLQIGIDQLGTQIAQLNYVTPEQFELYKETQKKLTDGLEQRISTLENEGSDPAND